MRRSRAVQRGETAHSEQLQHAPRAKGHGVEVEGKAQTALGDTLGEPPEAANSQRWAPRPLHPMCRCGLTSGWPPRCLTALWTQTARVGTPAPKRPVCPPSPGTWSATLPIGLFCPCFASGRLRHARGLLRARTWPEFGSCAGVVSAGKCGRLTRTAPGSTGARPLPAVVPSASSAVAPSLAAVSGQQPGAPGACRPPLRVLGSLPQLFVEEQAAKGRKAIQQAEQPQGASTMEEGPPRRQWKAACDQRRATIACQGLAASGQSYLNQQPWSPLHTQDCHGPQRGSEPAPQDSSTQPWQRRPERKQRQPSPGG